MSEVEKDLCNPASLREAITEVFNTMVFMEISPSATTEENLVFWVRSLFGGYLMAR